MGAPYEKHYSYNASGPDPDATGIWDAHIHRDVPRGSPQVYGIPIYIGTPLGGPIGICDAHIRTGAPRGHLKYMGLPYS